MTRFPLMGAVLALTIALAGCAVTSNGSGGTTAGPAQDTTPSSSATAFSFPCDDLVDPPTLSGFDASMTAVTSPTIDAATSAGKIQQLKGTVCEWADPSGATLIVAVAQPGAATLKSSQAAVAAIAQPASVGFGGIPSYFGSDEVNLFTDNGFWVSAKSSLFTAASDANGVVEDVLQALPAG